MEFLNLVSNQENEDPCKQQFEGNHKENVTKSRLELIMKTRLNPNDYEERLLDAMCMYKTMKQTKIGNQKAYGSFMTRNLSHEIERREKLHGPRKPLINETTFEKKVNNVNDIVADIKKKIQKKSDIHDTFSKPEEPESEVSMKENGNSTKSTPVRRSTRVRSISENESKSSTTIKNLAGTSEGPKKVIYYCMTGYSGKGAHERLCSPFGKQLELKVENEPNPKYAVMVINELRCMFCNKTFESEEQLLMHYENEYTRLLFVPTVWSKDSNDVVFDVFVNPDFNDCKENPMHSLKRGRSLVQGCCSNEEPPTKKIRKVDSKKYWCNNNAPVENCDKYVIPQPQRVINVEIIIEREMNTIFYADCMTYAHKVYSYTMNALRQKIGETRLVKVPEFVIHRLYFYVYTDMLRNLGERFVEAALSGTEYTFNSFIYAKRSLNDPNNDKNMLDILYQITRNKNYSPIADKGGNIRIFHDYVMQKNDEYKAGKNQKAVYHWLEMIDTYPSLREHEWWQNQVKNSLKNGYLKPKDDLYQMMMESEDICKVYNIHEYVFELPNFPDEEWHKEHFRTWSVAHESSLNASICVPRGF